MSSVQRLVQTRPLQEGAYVLGDAKVRLVRLPSYTGPALLVQRRSNVYAILFRPDQPCPIVRVTSGPDDQSASITIQLKGRGRVKEVEMSISPSPILKSVKPPD